MTMPENFERTVAVWLRTEAERPIPDQLDALLARTTNTRQRQWWSSPERWLPMDLTTRANTLAPPRRGLALIVILLTLTLIGAAIAFVGSRQQRPLAPFGPAANGSIVFGANDGDLYVFDPTTASSKALIAGPTRDVSPFFSRDGSMLVFIRKTTTVGRSQLMLANADGTVVRTLTDPLEESSIDWSSSLDWAPDGSRLAYIHSPTSTFSIVHVDGSPTEDIDLGMRAEDVRWRPNGQELVFRGAPKSGGAGLIGLFLVRADGTGLREILPPTNDDEHWQEPALSPDGNRIIYTHWGPTGGHLSVVEIDSGNTEQLVFGSDDLSDYFADWSPDGSQIVFNRGRAQETYRLAVGPATGGRVVDIGPELPWDAASIAVFSPDGSKVIARYNNGSTWIFDVTGGGGRRLETTSGDPLSWQRIAP